MGTTVPASNALYPEALGPTLVIAPHPDDETIACGGLIARLRRSGCPVWVAVITDGAASHQNSALFPAARLTATRKAETIAALAVLGVEEEHIVFDDLPDGFVPGAGHPGFDCAVANAVARLGRLLPQTLVVPSSADTHEDHRAVSAIWRRAGQMSPHPPRILEYIVWPRGLAPDERRKAVIDISDVLDLKHRAIAVYQSQLGLLITDDPAGLVLPRRLLNRATQSSEVFLWGDEPAPEARPGGIANTVVAPEYGSLTVTFPGHRQPATGVQAAPPTVSVVIPTYNRTRWVVRAVESALAQTVASRLEIIVVDDGSTDDTEIALSPYCGKIRYLKQANQGVVAARNNGIRHAGGDFIAFLDSDDCWLPWKIEAQLACFAVRPELALVWTNAVLVDDRQNPIFADYVRSYIAYRFFRDADLFNEDITADICEAELPLFPQAHLKTGDLSSAMFMGSFIVTPTVVVRREILRQSGVFDPALGQANEDYDLFWRICEQGRVGFLDLPAVTIGRPREGGLGRAFSALAVSDLLAVDKYYRRHPEGPKLPKALIAHRMVEIHARIALTKFDEDDRAAVRKHAWLAIRQRTRLHRVYFCFALALLPLFVTKLVRRALLRGRPQKIAAFSRRQRGLPTNMAKKPLNT